MTATSTLFSSVKPEGITWLLPGKIMIGDVCLICGPPGSLKTTLCCAFCARMSTGQPFPGATLALGGEAILAACEDKSSKSTIQRLMASHADLDRVIDASRIGPGGTPLRLPRDIPALRRICVLRPEVRLICLDPLGACANPRSPAIREVIEELRDVAEEREVAVVVTCHPTKDGETVAGSQELSNAARSVLIADGELRAIKSSYAGLDQPPVTYELSETGAIRFA
jgi:AAA domain